jgi:glutamate dehydrogenase (NAD(P)+)
LRTEMLAKVALLVERWLLDRVPPRQTAGELVAAHHNASALVDPGAVPMLVIP